MQSKGPKSYLGTSSLQVHGTIVTQSRLPNVKNKAKMNNAVPDLFVSHVNRNARSVEQLDSGRKDNEIPT